MLIREAHGWDVTPAEAVGIQRSLSKEVSSQGSTDGVRLAAGVDVSFSRKEDRVFASVCIMSYPALSLIEKKTASLRAAFPYVPGLLSFREGPVIIECFRKIENEPDIIIFDGQGICHPRRFGIASHIGVILKKPSIGCAKSHLYGDFRMPGEEKGSFEYIRDRDGTVIGACLRTRNGVRPVFVSVGNMVALDEAVKFVLSCTRKYRLPEPTRLAHSLAEEAKEE